MRDLHPDLLVVHASIGESRLRPNLVQRHSKGPGIRCLVEFALLESFRGSPAYRQLRRGRERKRECESGRELNQC